MLSERELEAAYNQIRWRIDKVNDEYLSMVGEQVKKIGSLTPSSMDRLSQMRIYGANVRRLKRKLAKELGMSVQEVQQLLEQTAREEYASSAYQAVVRDRGPVPLEFDQTLRRYIQAIAAQTQERFLNYSNTTNMDQAYREVVTDAVDAVARGVTDYQSAIRSSLRKLGGSGLRVTYGSGTTRRLDTAIRMNIIDGVKHVAEKAQEQIGAAINADGVELSAHPLSAPDHEPAQGRQYAMEEYRRMQEGSPFRDVEGKQYRAFRRPISEWNCRHFASHILLGISPRRYTDEQLSQWRRANHEGCVIDGRRYSRYEASQLMRQLETKVRAQKDTANLAKAAGDDVLRRECQANIRALKAKYTEVAQAAGLRQRTDKMSVDGYRQGQAARASLSARRITMEKLQFADGTTQRDRQDIEAEVADIPRKAREIAEKKISKIVVTNGDRGGFRPSTGELILNRAREPGTVAHEYAHAIETALNLYDDPEFLRIRAKGIENIKPSDIIFDETNFSKPIVRVWSDKFVSLYQGRLYEQYGIFDGKNVYLDGMREYFSEGFRVYIAEPEVLRRRDRDLFDYIERLLK